MKKFKDLDVADADEDDISSGQVDEEMAEKFKTLGKLDEMKVDKSVDFKKDDVGSRPLSAVVNNPDTSALPELPASERCDELCNELKNCVSTSDSIIAKIKARIKSNQGDGAAAGSRVAEKYSTKNTPSKKNKSKPDVSTTLLSPTSRLSGLLGGEQATTDELNQYADVDPATGEIRSNGPGVGKEEKNIFDTGELEESLLRLNELSSGKDDGQNFLGGNYEDDAFGAGRSFATNGPGDEPMAGEFGSYSVKDLDDMKLEDIEKLGFYAGDTKGKPMTDAELETFIKKYDLGVGDPGGLDFHLDVDHA